MNIGEIKIDALKLMFVNYNFNLDLDNLDGLIADENYGSYLVNMTGSINRALDRIENACVLPLERKEISQDEIEYSSNYIMFDTSRIKDLFLIDRITAITKNGEYINNVGYELEGNYLILKNVNATFTVLYYPKVQKITNITSNTDNVLVPDNIARLIPYFIKSELYQEEEPSLAQEARNLFEASLDDLKCQKQSKQDYVYQVYKMF